MANSESCAFVPNGDGDACCYKFFNGKNKASGGTKIDPESFCSHRSTLRRPNYLRNMGDKIFHAEGETYKFSNGNPNPNSFPFKSIQVTLKDDTSFEIKDRSLQDSLSYLSVQGHRPLINLLKEFQDKLHGKQSWMEKDISTTSGCQGGLSQILDIIVTDGEPVLVEAPVYTGLVSILEPLNVEFLEVEPDEQGVSATYLKNLLEERKTKNLSMPKVLYLNPTGTNPTGSILPTERKKEIYKLACEYNFLILEDDPYFLLSFKKERPVSFFSLDTENRIMRFDTFSKTMGAGFRMGYVTASKKIIAKLDLYKESTVMASPFCQIVLYEALVAMGFEGFLQHVESVKQMYYKNRESMLLALEKYMKEYAEWEVPEGAMFVWMKMKNVQHVPQSFIDKCVSKNIFIVPGFAFYAIRRLSPHIRLAFSMVSDEDIQKGVKMLADLYKEFIAKEREISQVDEI